MTIFFKKNRQNVSKILSKTHQIAPFLNNFSGEHAPEPPRAAWREAPCKYPHFSRKNILNPPEMKS